MAKETSNTIRLGLFVTVGVALFTFAIYLIGNQQNMFGAKFYVNTVVRNANGLQVGNNVRYAGIVIGSVSEIDILNDSTIMIEMALEERMSKFIRKDAIASIGTDGLVGNVIVNIKPGDGDETLAEEGDTIQSYARIDPNVMLETLGSTNYNVALLSKKLLEISTNLNEGQGTLAMLIRDSAMAENLGVTLKNLRRVSAQLAQTGEQLRQAMNGVSKGEGTLGYLLHDQTLPNQLENLTARLDSLVIGQTQPVVADLQKSSADIAASSAQLKAATEALNRGEGLATTILRDSVAADNLRKILENLDEGTARFSQNMEALKHNFFFRGYFKKLEKEQKKAAKQ